MADPGESDDLIARSRARLLGLRDNLPNYLVPVSHLAEYHEALDQLERAGKNVSEFRVPDRETGGRLVSSNYMTGQRRYSSEQYVNRDFYRARLDAVIGYFGFDNASVSVATVAPVSGPTQIINVQAGSVLYIAQTGMGNVEQRAEIADALKEIRALLSNLNDAIRSVQAPDDEREGLLEPVERLEEELRHTKPLASRLATGYGSLKVLATLQGAWAGLDHMRSAADAVAPKVEALIHMLTTAAH